MTAPTSNGAIVQDETVLTNVGVNYNFSNTGSGGVMEVFQSADIYNINSGFPAANDAGWTAALDSSGNAPPTTNTATSGNPFSHSGFTQPRGTTRYYYARRRNGASIELGAPYPVSELVPSQPFINNVTWNGSFTQATVHSSVSDSITTLYYYQSTSSTQPTWQATSSGQTSPTGVWQTSNVFTATAGVQYYYYVLGWTHNNPGADGAAISPLVSRFAGAAQGLQVFNAQGTMIVSLVDRLVRFVSTGVVTVNRGGFVNISISGMANDDTWGVALGTTPGLTWSTQAQFTKSTNNLRIDYIAPNFNTGGISNPASIPVTYYVFRT